MAQIRSERLRRVRFSVLSVLMSLVLAACGAVGVNSGPDSSASSVTGSGGNSNNTPPTISGTPAATVVAGSAYAFTPTASDADGDTLTFSVTNLPDWASFESSTGAISGTPAPASVGTYPSITISVSDGQSTTSLAPFSIAVLAPLTISGNPPTTVLVGSAYAFQPTTNAPSGTALTFSIMNAPAWASFDTTTGQLSGTPSQTGTFANVVISVTDGTQTSSMDPF